MSNPKRARTNSFNTLANAAEYNNHLKAEANASAARAHAEYNNSKKNNFFPSTCENIKTLLDKACAKYLEASSTNNPLGGIPYYNSAAIGFAKVKEMAGELEEIANDNYRELSGMNGVEN